MELGFSHWKCHPRAPILNTAFSFWKLWKSHSKSNEIPEKYKLSWEIGLGTGSPLGARPTQRFQNWVPSITASFYDSDPFSYPVDQPPLLLLLFRAYKQPTLTFCAFSDPDSNAWHPFRLHPYNTLCPSSGFPVPHFLGKCWPTIVVRVCSLQITETTSIKFY